MRHRRHLSLLVCAALAAPVGWLAAAPSFAVAAGPASETVYIQGHTAEINTGAAVIFDASAGLLQAASPIYIIEFPVAAGTTGPISLPSGYQPQHNGFPPSPSLPRPRPRQRTRARNLGHRRPVHGNPARRRDALQLGLRVQPRLRADHQRRPSRLPRRTASSSRSTPARPTPTRCGRRRCSSAQFCPNGETYARDTAPCIARRNRTATSSDRR